MMAVRAERYPGDTDGRPSPPTVVAYLAGGTADPALEGRASRLGFALTGLARELATARREIVVLKRENAEMRSRLTTQEAARRSEGP